jgi:hypothetical protein
MPIRTHISELSDEARLEKLGVKRRARPRELERQHQVALKRAKGISSRRVGRGLLCGHRPGI